MTVLEQFPYAELIDGLVRSIMRAEYYVVSSLSKGVKLAAIDHQQINRHFVWLSYANKEGRNRHLVEAAHGMVPLATQSLRHKSKIPTELRKILENNRAVAGPADIEGFEPMPDEFSKYVQTKATRISSLIVNSLRSLPRDLDADNAIVHGEAFTMRSPLSIAYDFLTVPDVPSTKAYALLACRNYLYSGFQLVPDVEHRQLQFAFSIMALETALSHITTSLRERYLSQGDDKLPPGSFGNIDGLVRHHLAMRRILNIRFRNIPLCLSYLKAAELIPKSHRLDPLEASEYGMPKLTYKFEFEKSDRLNVLPEAGEVINELWGLPLPIRGADVVFKGGLKFSGRGGLVMAVHGGPGAGKTSFALAFAAHLVPMGVSTWFLTGEESSDDLVDRVNGLLPDQVTRLSFFPKDITKFLMFKKFELQPVDGVSALDRVEAGIVELARHLKAGSDEKSKRSTFSLPSPCNAIVVLDGLHDLFSSIGFKGGSDRLADERARLYSLVEKLRDLHALVIVTTGVTWAGESTLDYLVDIAIRLTHESTDEYGKKPDRRFVLTKARHQLCAGGTHGLQIGGTKGVRLSPQINYQLERHALWRPRLPDVHIVRDGLRRAKMFKSIGDLAQEFAKEEQHSEYSSGNSENSVGIADGSHVFLNGQGSGGKAALAVKLAISPPLSQRQKIVRWSDIVPQRILVVSFLYPLDYYEHLLRRLRSRQMLDYRDVLEGQPNMPRIEVIHLYPGHLRPHDLFNKIEWELETAELSGDAYTCVIIDGIHNVFLQFPEIEKYSLFWPQIYNALRSRKVMTISTHTTLALPFQTWQPDSIRVDDNRSEPLRHALVQKTDFQFEIDPLPSSPFAFDGETLPPGFAQLAELYVVKVVSAIGKAIPKGYLLWSRERLQLLDLPAHYFTPHAGLNLSQGAP